MLGDLVPNHLRVLGKIWEVRRLVFERGVDTRWRKSERGGAGELLLLNQRAAAADIHLHSTALACAGAAQSD